MKSPSRVTKPAGPQQCPPDADDLDRALHAVFSNAFPRPDTLPFCDYDVTADEVARLCGDAWDAEAVRTFACHHRWEMFGDVTDFPAFAGDVAMLARRSGLTFSHDLQSFLQHLPGAFSAPTIRDVLSQWVRDCLVPWERSLVGRSLLSDTGFALDLLMIGALTGLDLHEVFDRHLERARHLDFPTTLMESLDAPSRAGNQKGQDLRTFALRRYEDLQKGLPPYIPLDAVDQVVDAFTRHRDAHFSAAWGIE